MIYVWNFLWTSTKKSFIKTDNPWMILVKLFLKSNEPLASIDGYRSHFCMYRIIPKAKAMRNIQRRREKINYQLKLWKNVWYSSNWKSKEGGSNVWNGWNDSISQLQSRNMLISLLTRCMMFRLITKKGFCYSTLCSSSRYF